MKFRHTTAVFLLVVLSLSWGDSKETKERENQRLRRQLNSCQDGNFTVDGKTCCLCAAGQRLTKRCKETRHPECEPCLQGVNYNSRPNSDLNCEPCTSCAHQRANLEVKEECTIAKDAVCQCKKDYYCNSGTCTFCNPCDPCHEGKTIKVSCTRTTNTICEEKAIGPGTIVKICLAVLVPVAVAVAVLFYMRKRRGKKKSEHEFQQCTTDLDQIEDGDLSPHVPAIAALLKWTVMRDIALADGILKATIDSHQENHRNNTQEQVFHLLQDWIQMMGKKAPRELVKRLRDKKMNDTVEKVLIIIQRSSLPHDTT